MRVAIESFLMVSGGREFDGVRDTWVFRRVVHSLETAARNYDVESREPTMREWIDLLCSRSG